MQHRRLETQFGAKAGLIEENRKDIGLEQAPYLTGRFGISQSIGSFKNALDLGPIEIIHR